MDHTPINTKTAAAILIIASVAVGIFIDRVISPDFAIFLPGKKPPAAGIPSKETSRVARFASKQEFLDYLAEGQAQADLGLVARMLSLGKGFEELGAPVPQAVDGRGGGGAERVSETNVQVPGIDEPDIVKTDGQKIYFARDFFGPIIMEERGLEPQAMPEGERAVPSSLIYPSPYIDRREVKIVKAFPPAELAKAGKIEKFGNLLLSKNILVILPNDNSPILGYDVSRPEAPAEKWKMDLEDRSSIVTARLHQGRIYLVISTWVNYPDPCPIVPLKIKGAPVTIPCSEIYHPITRFPADVTYTAFVIEPETGKVEKTVSFVGAGYSSVVYMSKNALYLTYPFSGDVFGFWYSFLKTKASDLVPSVILERLAKIRTYELSDATKLSETMLLLEKHFNSLGEDERRRVENELANRLSDYAKEHARQLAGTGIVKVGLEQFAVAATGSVPGMLLNQFSLDEFESYLRVATTIDAGGIGFLGFGAANAESANDVYVLNQDLQVTGSVQDLGLTERIYSVRFVGDKGYVVTFRQIDPFYVLDLKNPRKPELKGELKIPGFSSYLHPLKEDRVLGVGQESSQVKLSLFDVASAANPKEADKYLLDEYWSEVQNNHHAFLADQDKQVFFLPAGNSGYIFSYRNDRLELKKVVSNIEAKRAIYLDDYLYVIGQEKIVVLNENTWEEVKRLEFD